MSIQEELDRFTADALYLDEHQDELLERYPEQWVAVDNLAVSSQGITADLGFLIDTGADSTLLAPETASSRSARAHFRSKSASSRCKPRSLTQHCR